MWEINDSFGLTMDMLHINRVILYKKEGTAKNPVYINFDMKRRKNNNKSWSPDFYISRESFVGKHFGIVLS